MQVAIVGSGLAGLAAAVDLVDAGHKVDLYEARPFMGGKVGSWVDENDNHIEMGLHVFFFNYANLFALMRKAEETGQPVTAPCIVMASGDTIAAREASLLENVARLPATELEQFAAFKALAEAGQTAAEIAATFGLTELRVKRVLALAKVHPDILALYESDQLGQESLRYMTMATEAQQTAWLDLWRGPEYAPQHGYLKEWLTGGTPISIKAALFPIEGYDGHIVTDLFGGETEWSNGYFQDADLFWQHQNRAIADHIDTLKADGWTSVTLLERGDYFERYESGELMVERNYKYGGLDGKTFIWFKNGQLKSQGSYKYYGGSFRGGVWRKSI